MTKMDYDRPILKLIDDVRRHRTKTIATVTKRKPSGKKLPAEANAENIPTHRAACSVLTHVGKYRDVRMVDRLLEGVPIAQRRRLRNWFAEFGPVRSYDRAWPGDGHAFLAIRKLGRREGLYFCEVQLGLAPPAH